jgi:polyphosphate kinase
MTRNLESRVELLTPVEDSGLRDQLRAFLDMQLNDRRGAWELRADGSYIQLQPRNAEEDVASQTAMVDVVVRELKKATRLRTRRPESVRIRKRRG